MTNKRQITYLHSKCVRYYLWWLSIFWFCQQNCVYYTDLGQKIGKEKDVVYVSTTQGRTWTELAQFALGNTSEAYLFLEHQLELFRYLCHVRINDFIISIILWGSINEGYVDDPIPRQECKLTHSLLIFILTNLLKSVYLWKFALMN